MQNNSSAHQRFNLADHAAIGIGAMVGVSARWFISASWNGNISQQFPVGTFIVNVVGCLLMGVAQAWLGAQVALHPRLRLGIIVGLLGGFTTFSTMSLETLELLTAGRIRDAVVYQGLSLGMGLAAILLGGAAIQPVLDRRQARQRQ